MQHIRATDEEQKKIDELMHAPYPVMLSTIAAALSMTELEVARRLPESDCAFVLGSVSDRFDVLWEELARWEKVTLLIAHDGHIFEVENRLSSGKRAQGYYNILAKDAVIGGHLKYDAVAACAFISMPFMGRESHAVHFFNDKGAVSFSIYVGRENHKLVENAKDAFFAAREAFCR